MKTQRRWLQAVLAESAKPQPALPWQKKRDAAAAPAPKAAAERRSA